MSIIVAGSGEVSNRLDIARARAKKIGFGLPSGNDPGRLMFKNSKCDLGSNPWLKRPWKRRIGGIFVASDLSELWVDDHDSFAQSHYSADTIYCMPSFY